MPTDIYGQKWACWACIIGHRATGCRHFERVQYRVRSSGRPPSKTGPDGECGCKRKSILMTQVRDNGRDYCVPTHRVREGGILEPYRPIGPPNPMSPTSPRVTSLKDGDQAPVHQVQTAGNHIQAASTPFQAPANQGQNMGYHIQATHNHIQGRDSSSPAAKRQKQSAEGSFRPVQEYPESFTFPRQQPVQPFAPAPAPGRAPLRQFQFVHQTMPGQSASPAMTSSRAPVAPMRPPQNLAGMPPTTAHRAHPAPAPVPPPTGYIAPPSTAPHGLAPMPWAAPEPPGLATSTSPTYHTFDYRPSPYQQHPPAPPTRPPRGSHGPMPNLFQQMQCGVAVGLCQCGPSCACPDCLTHNVGSAVAHRNSMSGPLEGVGAMPFAAPSGPANASAVVDDDMVARPQDEADDTFSFLHDTSASTLADGPLLPDLLECHEPPDPNLEVGFFEGMKFGCH